MFNYLNATYCDPWKEKYNKAAIEIMHIFILSIVGIVMFGIFGACRKIRHNQPLLQDRIDEGEAPQRSWGIGLSIEGGLDELQPGLYEIEPGQVENLEYNQEGGI